MPITPGQQELLDIPGGTRNALILTGVAGLIVTIVASLEGGSGTTLEVDKILAEDVLATRRTKSVSDRRI